MKKLIVLSLSSLFAITCYSQHSLITKNDGVLDVKITEIGDSTISYQLKGEKNGPTQTIAFRDVKSYRVRDGITHRISVPKRDTLVSLLIDKESTMLLQQFADNQNKQIGKALKTTGTISMAIGVPCVAAGLASVLYANLLPNPTSGYTTSQTLANQNHGLQYMSAETYIDKLEEYNGKVRAANNAGYIMLGAGSALTIVGIPLYCYGNHLMQLTVNYTGNGAGLSVNF